MSVFAEHNTIGFFVPDPIGYYFEPGLTPHTATPLPALRAPMGGGSVCYAFDDSSHSTAADCVSGAILVGGGVPLRYEAVCGVRGLNRTSQWGR